MPPRKLRLIWSMRKLRKWIARKWWISSKTCTGKERRSLLPWSWLFKKLPSQSNNKKEMSNRMKKQKMRRRRKIRPKTWKRKASWVSTVLLSCHSSLVNLSLRSIPSLAWFTAALDPSMSKKTILKRKNSSWLWTKRQKKSSWRTIQNKFNKSIKQLISQNRLKQKRISRSLRKKSKLLKKPKRLLTFLHLQRTD